MRPPTLTIYDPVAKAIFNSKKRLTVPPASGKLQEIWLLIYMPEPPETGDDLCPLVELELQNCLPIVSTRQ